MGAGAGTGKTWVLSNRYARLLLMDADCLPCDILTLTYTDAAAGEMRRRIEDRVRALMDVQDAPVSQERRREVLEGFSEAWISTIHAFAARLVRESGLALDVDPRSAVFSSAIVSPVISAMARVSPCKNPTNRSRSSVCGAGVSAAAVRSAGAGPSGPDSGVWRGGSPSCGRRRFFFCQAL